MRKGLHPVTSPEEGEEEEGEGRRRRRRRRERGREVPVVLPLLRKENWRKL